MINIKRLFSAESSSKRLFSDIFKDNSGSIVASGAIISGAFGIGLYVNQMRVVEEKIKTTEEKIKTAEERAKKEALEHLYAIFTQEEFKDAKKKMMAQKNKIVNSE